KNPHAGCFRDLRFDVEGVALCARGNLDLLEELVGRGARISRCIDRETPALAGDPETSGAGMNNDALDALDGYLRRPLRAVTAVRERLGTERTDANRCREHNLLHALHPRA